VANDLLSVAVPLLDGDASSLPEHRVAGADPHVITVVGNHDTVLGQTAGITIQQRYRNTEEVVCHELERRLEPATCELCCQSTRVKRC
jgi:hypothetical protein